MKTKVWFLTVLVVVAIGLFAKDEPKDQVKEPVLITGVVVAFADDTKDNYGCALVATGDINENNMKCYIPVWYPLVQDNVVIDGKVSYYCKTAPPTFKPISFRVQQYKVGEIDTLNPSRTDNAQLLKASSIVPYQNPIGDYGSTVMKHIFKKQMIAVSFGPK